MKTWEAWCGFHRLEVHGVLCLDEELWGKWPLLSLALLCLPSEGPSPKHVDPGPAHSSSAHAFCKNLPLGHHVDSLRGSVHSLEDEFREDELGEEGLEADSWPFGPGIPVSGAQTWRTEGCGAFSSAPQILCAGGRDGSRAGPSKARGPGKRSLQSGSKDVVTASPLL